MLQDNTINPYSNTMLAPMKSSSGTFGKHRASESHDLRISDPYAIKASDY